MHESAPGPLPPKACNAARLQPEKADINTRTSTTYAATYGMWCRHVVGRSKFINKITALSKWHLPPCTPDIPGLSLYIEGRLGLCRIGFIVSSWVRSSLPWLFSLVDVVAS
jgi:hypothetical protein